MSKAATDRRSFLKTGALVAAPLAMVAPSPVLADDGGKARLARLEDEQALRSLHRDVVRGVNAGERRLAEGLTALTADPAHEMQIAFADDGLGATCRRACTASFRTEFAGTSTLEQMHRLQGQGLHSHQEPRELVGEYRKSKDGWVVERVRLA